MGSVFDGTIWLLYACGFLASSSWTPAMMRSRSLNRRLLLGGHLFDFSAINYQLFCDKVK